VRRSFQYSGSAGAVALLWTTFAYGADPAANAMLEINNITTQFGVPLIQLSATGGNRKLSASQSLTAAMLQGVAIQPNPPELTSTPVYPPNQQDAVPAPPPYISSDLGNFRFQYFNNLFNFAGYHTWPSTDYAAVHGFNSVSAYSRNSTTSPQMPSDTQWMASFSYPNWVTFMGTLGLDAGRYDELVDLGEDQIVQAVIQSGTYATVTAANSDQLMLDMEHAALDPPTLRQQAWYPSASSPADRAAFEKKYYDGFALSEYAPVDAARQLGFKNISLYGWKPVSAGWFQAATFAADPATDWYWQNVGIQVVSHVDSINNSVYCYYWTIANAAYTLAQNDLNLKFVSSLPAAHRKPVHPYFWNQLHGGGGGWRWWAGQALATEEMQAITLLNAFTQYDGMVLWNWSGTGNDNVPPPLVVGTDVMVRDGSLSAVREGGGAQVFARYDALHITALDGSGNVQFQLIDKANINGNYGVGAAFPFYDSTVDVMTPRLRAPSESLAAIFEGLAVAKLLEWNLRNDTQVVDFDAQRIYAQTLPISRHLSNGTLHIIATYDPQVVYGQPARNVVIPNFAGVDGLTVTLAADSQVRVFFLQVCP
jgi:hypothetical protein